LLAGIGATAIFRIVSLSLWLNFVWPEPGAYALTVFNRLTWISFLLTYMLLVFGWIETVHSKYPPPSDRFRPVFKWTMVVIGGVAVASQVSTLICYLVLNARKIDEAGIWIFNAFLILLSVAFLVYGSVLLGKLTCSAKNPLVQINESQLRRQKNVFVKIILIMSILSICCMIKVAAMMTRPLGWCFPIGWFWVTAYMIPEIVPAVVEMIVIASTFESKVKMDELRADVEDDDSMSFAIPLLPKETR
jgi:hypothetical protein